jgi:nucleoid-associated protein YgaU
MAYIDKFRNRNRFVFSNDDELYEDILRRKRITSLRQYETPLFPSLQSKPSIKTFPHIWKTGDRYYKLAAAYYGRPQLWWVIALYNQKPTEGHLKRGDVIKIPTSLDLLLYYL